VGIDRTWGSAILTSDRILRRCATSEASYGNLFNIRPALMCLSQQVMNSSILAFQICALHLKDAPGNHIWRCLTRMEKASLGKREKKLMGWKDVDGPYPTSTCDVRFPRMSMHSYARFRKGSTFYFTW